MEYKKVFTNTLFQVITRLLTSAVTFCITIIIARQLGVTGYGNFTKVTTVIGIGYLLLDFGFNASFLQSSSVSLRQLFSLRIMLAIVYGLIINTILYLLPFASQIGNGFSIDVKLGILILSFSLLSQAMQLCLQAVFQKKLEYKFLAISSISGSLFSLAFVMAFSQSLSLVIVLIAIVGGSFLSCLIALLFLKEKIIPLSMRGAYLAPFIKESLPLGIILVFNFLYFRVDMVVLSLLRPTAEVGIYGFSYKFFDFLIALPLFLSNSLYPLLLQKQKNRQIGTAMTRKYFFVFLASSILLMIPAWYAFPYISLVNHEFIASVLSFRILLLSLPFFFMTNFLQWLLIVYKQQRYLLFVYIFVGIINIFTNILLIPVYSYLASALITGISEAIVFIMLLARVVQFKKFIQNGD